MTQKLSIFSVVFGSLLGGLTLGCEPGGVGDPCTPEDEYEPGFSGFSVEEVNVESKSFQCETRICLVNHFRGRVSCPYGNEASSLNGGQTPPACIVPGNERLKIEAPVDPQIARRRAEDAVYCSCRCDGPDANARYCDCPSGFKCERLVEDLGSEFRGGQLAGSYCVREGTEYQPNLGTSDKCEFSAVAGGDTSLINYCGPVDKDGQPQ